MNTYDPKKIGKMLSLLSEHTVYEYGTDEVIKFSKFDIAIGREKARQAYIKDYEIGRRFFGTYFLETRVVTSPDGKRVAIIQPKVSGHFLGMKDMERESVRRQFAEIEAGYHALVKAGNPEVEFIGSQGALHRRFSNILVTADDRLIIIDATVMDTSRFPVLLRLLIYATSAIVRRVQNWEMRAFQNHH